MTKTQSRVRLTALSLALVGLLIATLVVAYFNFGHVLAAMAKVGWGGFLVVIACQLALFAPLGLAWLTVASGQPLGRAGAFMWGRLLREAASDVLPFSQLGGVMVGARAIILNGVPGPATFASSVVDITCELFAQLIYTLIGIGLLVMRLGDASKRDHLVWMLGIGVGVAFAMAGLFVFAQRRGAPLAEQIAGRLLPAAAAHTAGFNQAIERAYGEPRRLLACWCLHISCWFGSAVGTWVILDLLGDPLPFASVVAIESLLFAIRNAAFVVPSALGVQEGAYALLGPLFGLPPEAALALSLLKRARDIAIGIPALMIWQLTEQRRRSLIEAA